MQAKTIGAHTLPLDIAKSEETAGLAGPDLISRKSEAGESIMLQAYSAPLDGSTASFGRTAAMLRESLNPSPRCPEAGCAVGAEEGEAKQVERRGRRNEGGRVAALMCRDMYVIEEGKPPWGRRTSA